MISPVVNDVVTGFNTPPTVASGAQPSFRPRFYREPFNNGGHVMQDANVPTETVSGFLEIMNEGHGFLRPKFIPSDRDIYISQSQIRKFNLRSGDEVSGQARQPKDNERYFGLLKVENVNGIAVETLGVRARFDDLVPIYPKEMIKLEVGKDPVSCRIIDLFAPIGFGQRGLIVSPPKAGKTTILKEIASGISSNYPNVHLMAVLIGERPEEVTDISRSIKGEVIASHFDESPAEQTKVAEIGLDRAKRQVEIGKDVVILLDSITRLARAYNLTVNSSGRTLSGGFDPAALYPAKRFLGAARKNENGGSLTIIGTALVETGSRMDDLIYEEFKGTGNMELHLNRSLAERRVFPAIDIEKSGTRQEHLLIPEDRMKKIVTLRNMLSLLNDGVERTMAVIERLNKTTTNEEFLEGLSKGG
jgi:transcription termination factor Rho